MVIKEIKPDFAWKHIQRSWKPVWSVNTLEEEEEELKLGRVLTQIWHKVMAGATGSDTWKNNKHLINKNKFVANNK